MAIQAFDEDSIARILAEHRAGSSLGEICRRYNISTENFYSWKLRQDVERQVVARVAAIEDENRRLKMLVAELSLDYARLREVLAKRSTRARSAP